MLSSTLFSQNRWLTWAILFHLIMIPVTVVGVLIDPRVLTGAQIWIKPLKFALSGAIYCITFAWLLSYVVKRNLWINWAASITGIALTVETVLISMQAYRGVRSHFNNTTPFDMTVFGLMGLFIVFVSIANLVLALYLIRQKMTDRVFAWSLRLGVLAAFAGMMIGPLMTTPNADQMAAMEAGTWDGYSGAHSVGVADDAATGLPFVNWSTVSGDYRPAHFIGLHGIQLIPLLGWVLTRKRWQERNSEGQRITVVIAGGLAYIGLTGVLTWQAMRAQSIIAPDSITLAALATLAVGFGLVTLLAIGKEAAPQRASIAQ